MDLKKKVGPLPLWGWGAATTGVALVWYVLHKQKTNAAAAANSTANQTAVGGVSPGTSYIPPGNQSYYYDVGPETSPGTDAGTTTDTTTPANQSGSVLATAIQTALQTHITELSNYEQELARDQATNLPNYKANIAPTQAAIAAEQSYIATDIQNLMGVLSGSLTSPSPYTSGRLAGTTPSGT